MNDKQQRFAEEYLIDLNATQAAIRAGYSEDTAGSQAHDLLKKPEIQTFIQERQLALREATQITQERVLKEYARIAFSDIRKFYNEDGEIKKITDLDDEAAAALAGVDVDEIYEYIDGSKTQIGHTKKIKIHDKLRALDALAKHLGMFKDDAGNTVNLYNVTLNL